MPGINEQATTLLHEQSPPSEHAIQAERETQSAAHEQAAGATDRLGRTFDPSIHETVADGSPRLSPKGNLCIKRGNAKRKGQTQPRQPGPSIVGRPGGASGLSTSVPGETISQGSLAVAVTTVDSIQALTLMVGGEEWAYQKREDIGVDERKAGIEVWSRYFEENGIRDIPPNLALVLWGASYAVPRFFAPKTKSRLKRVGGWFKSKFRKGGKGKGNGSRPDSGDDRKREKHASGTTDETLQERGTWRPGIRPAS